MKMRNPTDFDYDAAIKILRYLKTDPFLGPTYSSKGNNELIGFADADWAGCKESRKSTSGYIFKLAGAAISWKSKKQSTIATSSAEAEYIALFSATQEAIHLRNLLKDLNYLKTSLPTKIYEDNKACREIANNNITTDRTKHFDVKYHFIREKIINGDISIIEISSDKMLADLLTKYVGKQILDRLSSKIFGTQQLKKITFEGEY